MVQKVTKSLYFKLECRTFTGCRNNYGGVILQICSRQLHHAHLGAIVCINFVVLLRPKLHVKFEYSTFNGNNK